MSGLIPRASHAARPVDKVASALAFGWSIAATLSAPVLRLNLRRRAAGGREITSRLPERRGIDNTPRPVGPLLWMHAASVGETLSILPVLEALKNRVKILLTTGTVTSQKLLDQRIRDFGLAGDVMYRFAPLDVPLWVARFLSHWRPDAACFVESELWPNQVAACHATGIPLALINARMSDRSFARWKQAPGFARRLLGSFTLIQARGQQDARRFGVLGARVVESPGDLKFAAAPLPVDQVELHRLRAAISDRPIWLAASTHQGEENAIAEVHRRLAPFHPGLLTIIAPRHPDRGSGLAAALRAPRRSAGEGPPTGAGIWIVDTIGELGLWYRLAPTAFVGRSLLPPGGGQNPLEPARLGCAVVVGPHTHNFTEPVTLLRDAGGLVEAADVAALTEFIANMLRDPEQRDSMGRCAAAAAGSHADLPKHTAEALLSLLPAPYHAPPAIAPEPA